VGETCRSQARCRGWPCARGRRSSREELPAGSSERLSSAGSHRRHPEPPVSPDPEPKRNARGAEHRQHAPRGGGCLGRGVPCQLGGSRGPRVEQSHLFEELRRSYDTVLLMQRELVRAEKLRSLGELSAGIAHDLNNLLSIIVGQTEVILRRAGDERTKEAGRTVYQAATGAQDVVRRVQTFARRDGGEALTRCVLRDLVTETLDLTRTRWRTSRRRKGGRSRRSENSAGCRRSWGQGPRFASADEPDPECRGCHAARAGPSCSRGPRCGTRGDGTGWSCGDRYRHGDP